ncbi:AraC family transcriptional regulator [Paenibacillus sp. 598K]|uniref:helix-turn-helix domain-containing protein n=1 Tax=Paenibacillus sp. 598K TaxID=1117987 RepID=UPI000FF9D79F|nr:AraC family transcriptional regulator [Paenibacillus sp. 598K]GBF75714.1 AraC family transcriptional regulator [Paenibacillus sp. 598K]
MIRLINCGYHYVHEEGIVINRPKGAGNYAFVLFKSLADVVIDGTPTAVAKNTCILLGPHTSHQYKDREKPFVNDWFHCEIDAPEPFLEEIGFPLDTPVHIEDANWVSRCILELQSTLSQNSRLQPRIIDCELRAFFMKLLSLREKWASLASSNRHYPHLSRLRNELYNAPYQAVSVELLAARLNMSKSYFQHMYKQLFGCSVVSDIINARLEYAKYLLAHSKLSVSAISGMCGYENDTHFMRQFKKFVGTTPSRYKLMKQQLEG